MRSLSKNEALAELERHKQQLLRQPGDCVMCALAARRDPELLVLEHNAGSVVLDRFGNRAGHLLVVGSRHVQRATELSWAEYSELQRLTYDACHALERALKPKRVYTAALGSSLELPMTYAHFHLHVVPLLEEGEGTRPAEVFSWSHGVVSYDESEARSLVSELRRAWPRL
ncbi:MAG TPA: HIT domain-containing protein [Polyangiaceae bacterium]|nr:HIT domain-containing protein [Polyangiaceae bacterium]